MESVNLDMLSAVPFLPPYVYSYKVLFIWVIYVKCTLDDCQSIHDFLKKNLCDPFEIQYNLNPSNS